MDAIEGGRGGRTGDCRLAVSNCVCNAYCMMSDGGTAGMWESKVVGVSLSLVVQAACNLFRLMVMGTESVSVRVWRSCCSGGHGPESVLVISFCSLRTPEPVKAIESGRTSTLKLVV